jgi:GNAT superfamily N-acetyltransferase
MSLQIEIIRKARHLNDFLKLPWSLYGDDPNWVPPLLSDQKKLLHPAHNPFFKHAQMTRLIARRDGRTVGRICAIDNLAHQEYWQEPVGFFGFFECENDPETARALVDAAAEWLKPRGIDVMRGPMNPSTNDSCGLLVEGFDLPPMVMMPYNPPYYAELLEGTGFSKTKDLYAYKITEDSLTERILRVGEKLAERVKVTVRSIDKKNLDAEIERIRSIYNQAWFKNWGFVPMTEAEFNHTANDLKKILVPELAYIAEDGDRPVGFSLALPDINMALKHANGRLFPFGIFKLLYYSRKINSARVITTGVVEEYRNRGVDVLFYLESYKRGVAAGYTSAELSWILEDNEAMNKAVTSVIGGELYKRYRIYDKAL